MEKESKAKLESLKKAYEKDGEHTHFAVPSTFNLATGTFDLTTWEDPLSVGALLLLFLRKLPEPLVTYASADHFLHTAGTELIATVHTR